jgi:hypothetical protein
VLWDRWHRRRGEEAIDVTAAATAFDDGIRSPGAPQPEGAAGG